MPGSVIIVGAGPGLGSALARRFADRDRPIALLARQRRHLEAVAATVSSRAEVGTIEADCRDEASLRGGLDVAVDRFGPPEVVVYNAAVVRADHLHGVTLHDLRETWGVNVGGAVITAAHLLPIMADVGGGSYLISSGMPEPKPEYLTLSLGKFGIRTLVRILDSQFASRGVHVASVTIGGIIASGTRFDPDAVAERYWSLHGQSPGSWDTEIVV
ncbi:SDR family NAD(P)-dependent oxidoreductase [Pseudonocardia sp. NPDC046786]|uniref:SDR family NAD(P)-dependent oxidoreductase n=1 Tax=Pseudonocardia sp. NPDC046786 TaxID=3155471 RepID=UPI003400FAA3